MPLSFFETSMGLCSIAYSESGITSLDLFVEEGRYDDMSREPSEYNRGMENASSASALLVRYLDGENIDFDSIKIDMSRYSDFFTAVCNAVRYVPYGHVVTYGEVAVMAGFNGAARAVGRVMAKNPVPVIIPCHRVVASDGSLAGYSAAGGIKTKERFLQMEGAGFSDHGRILMKGGKVNGPLG